VTRGEPMSAAFADPVLISPSVHAAIRSGEDSGEIDRLLINVAAFLDEENEVVIRSLTSIIEPLILIIMGLLVGLVSICMFMPLFDLTAMTQTGGGG
jgi:type IV pilus assembly protein PilC